jgi:nucleoside-diphosphate-sugar epimerase
VAKTLVTGGSGFLGSHLVRALAARGDDLRLLLRRGSSVDHLSDLEFERASGDVLDRATVRGAMEGVERVFHVAGTTSMRPQDRDRTFELNTTGTRIVLGEALAAEVGRVVHASSVAAVGPPESWASPTSTPSTRLRSRPSGSPHTGCP